MTTFDQQPNTDHMKTLENFNHTICNSSDRQFPYTKITPRKRVDQFGLDRTDNGAHLLSTTVFPTGVKVKFLSEASSHRCGFDIVAGRKIKECGASEDSDIAKASLLTPECPSCGSVVAFVEKLRSATYGNRQLGLKDKSTKLPVTAQSQDHNAVLNSILARTNHCSPGRTEIDRDQSGTSSEIKNKAAIDEVNYDAPGRLRKGTNRRLKGRSENNQERGPTNFGVVSARTGFSKPTLSGYHASSLPLLPQVSRSRPWKICKITENVMAPALTLGGKSVFGKLNHSGTGRSEHQLERNFQSEQFPNWSKTGGNQLRSKNQAKVQDNSSFKDGVPVMEIISWQDLDDQVDMPEGEMHSNLPMEQNRSHTRIRCVEIPSRQLQGRSLKRENGKYRPLPKNKEGDYNITKAIPTSQIRPQKSVETYRQYLDSLRDNPATSIIFQSSESSTGENRALMLSAVDSDWALRQPCISPSWMSVTTDCSQNLAFSVHNVSEASLEMDIEGI